METEVQLFVGIVNLSTKNHNSESVKVKNEQVNFLPAGEAIEKDAETYIVQSGDTVESIMIRFYGSFSPEKAKIVQQANNLKNLNRLQIGQQLTIPMN